MNKQPIIDALTLAVRNAESRLYMAPVSLPREDRAAMLTELKRYRMGLAAAVADAKGGLPQYDECGCCDHLHRPEFRGDCRDDGERMAEIEESHGFGGFLIHELDEQ